MVEADEEKASEIVRNIHSRTGRAHVVGITGAPGAGKSTLVDGLADTLRNKGLKVGVIAIDPSSPFTGGAFLGDRIRMQKRSTDPDVFIRSMGSRGSLGGLSRATGDAVKVLDALGKDIILIETVGVGQAEIDIVKVADTTVVVLVPGMGDEIQSIKAGIMEIGDIFVVNKADRDGADKTVAEVEMMLMMGLGSEDPRERAAREQEEAAHHVPVSAEERVREFMDADVVHAAEHTGAARRIARDKAKADVPATEGGEEDGKSFFEELLESGIWYPPVHRTVAAKGDGIAELADYLFLHDDWLDESGARETKRAARAERELVETMKDRLFREVEEREHLRNRFRELVGLIAERKEDPYTAATELLDHFRTTSRGA
ncbi:MAG: methylmalonyl Co-A mutase-associated GTPase MeaB [Euryarchaeota archaeon]|nr:methylmalonyl Co-A mutase-associated GTPase MeaB [Euryarchaeota archaeon]